MIFARVIQGIGGAVFPLAFSIIRDEFPRERVAQGIAMISALVGIGGGLGIVLAGPITENLNYHWLFWLPLLAIVPADDRDDGDGAGVADPQPRPDRPARRRAAGRLAGGAAGGGQRGAELGLDVGRHARPVRAGRACSPSPGWWSSSGWPSRWST